MHLPVVLQAIATATFVAGAIFTAIQLRSYTAAREREVALELLNSLRTPDFIRGLRIIYDLPEGLPRAEVEARVAADMALLYTVMTTWESLGVLVFRRQIRLGLVEDFFSGSILLTWQKLGRYVEEERAARARSTLLEWFQWMAERVAERESKTPAVPAYEAHRRWNP